jgi:preprotein translocase subunit YajC
MLIDHAAFLALTGASMHPVFQAFLAQTAEGQPAQNPVVAFLPFILIAVVFYFVFFRPQQKQAKQHQTFLGALKKGDEVVTQGGLVGTVVLVEDRTVTIDVGAGTKVRVLKGHVSGAWQEKPAAAAQEKK